jgi:hypothetical protein
VATRHLPPLGGTSGRSRTRSVGPRARPERSLPPARRWPAVASVLVTMLVAALSFALMGVARAGAASEGIPPLESAVLDQALPGFAAVPAGPTNGPLTATEFSSQSSSPQQAERQFAALAAQHGFGAFIRLWTDRSGPGLGANDLAVLLFRIPDATTARSFTEGLIAPFEGGHATSRFEVPSVPGAHGYSIRVTTPVDATEQVVVFRAGRYVSMIQLASTTSTSNPDPLTSTQAVTASYQQYQLLRHVDPQGSAPVTAPAQPAPGTPSATATTAGSTSWALVALAVVVVAAVGVGLWLVVRRRRSGVVTGPQVDPWAPDGIFASFVAIDPRGLVEDATGPKASERAEPGAGVTGATDQERPAQMVPALVPAAPGGWEGVGSVADPVGS